MPDRKTIASKFFVFTAVLICWVLAVLLAYDVHDGGFTTAKAIGLAAVVLAIAGAISLMTARLLTRPLQLLQDGIRSVEEGRLEPIQVSRTGDEIEQLGASFNRMVAALATSKAELLQYQETLEERIRTRTEELQQSAQEATAASQAKTEFLANMSHELRTPMNGLLGMLEIVLSSKLTPEQRDHVETAQSCGYSLLALLNDVLDLSKIEAGHMELERVPFDIRDVIAESVKPHAALASRKGVGFSVEVRTGVPVEVIGDPLRLRQILANLLSNAVKFTSTGHIALTVENTGEAGGAPSIAIRVEDTGLGIPSGKLESIFEKFTQADGGITRKYGGTGLGLTITKSLVTLHGGRISVESELGKGSTFTVELPYETSRAQGVDAAAQGPTRVLVVDDNAVNRKMVSAILQRHGYDVLVANDGSQGLSMIDCEPLDCVLMDIQMPVLDGLEATRLLRTDERWSKLPVIAMTAHAMTGDQQSCLEAGMTGYITKPVHASALLRMVAESVREHRQGKQAAAAVA